MPRRPRRPERPSLEPFGYETWRQLIEASAAVRTDKPIYHPPATRQDLSSAEESLGIRFPTDLVDLLLESNGLDTEYGDFVWSVNRIAEENHTFRTCADFSDLYMPFDCLLFFAQELNGDQYAFRILKGQVQGYAVFRWDHESDSRVCIAGHLPSFVQRWLRNEFSS